MTNTQWLRIQSFLNTCSGLYVGHEARSSIRGSAMVAGRVREGEIGLSSLGRWVRPGRLAYRQAAPARFAVWLDSTVKRAHASAAGAPQKRDGSRPRPRPRQLPHPDPYLDGSIGPSPAPARDGRPAPRPHPSPGPGGRLDQRTAVLSDRGSGL